MINKYGTNYKEIEAEREKFNSGWKDVIMLLSTVLVLMGLGAGFLYLIQWIT